MIKSNSEKCHIIIKRRPRLQRQTARPTSHNLQRQTKSKAVAELHPLARFGWNFTTHSRVGHVLYVDNNLHLF